MSSKARKKKTPSPPSRPSTTPTCKTPTSSPPPPPPPYSQQASSPTLSSYRHRTLSLFYSYSWLVPVSFALGSQAACWVTYVGSIRHGQVDPFFPYISDCAVFLPQAHFFATMLDVCALMAILTGYIRYGQIQYYVKTILPKLTTTPTTSNGSGNGSIKALKNSNKDSQWILGLSFVSLCATCGASLALMMVGNYRIHEDLLAHFGWISVSFVLAMVFCVIQILIILKLNQYRLETRPRSLILFTTLCIACICSQPFVMVTAIYQTGSYSSLMEHAYRHHWPPEDPAYWTHALGAVLEWSAIGCFGAIHLCFARRMWAFSRAYPEWWE